MRPRHKAAENVGVAAVRAPEHEVASMRPRHKAAENEEERHRMGSRKYRFNEAAA